MNFYEIWKNKRIHIIPTFSQKKNFKYNWFRGFLFKRSKNIIELLSNLNLYAENQYKNNFKILSKT